MQDCDIILNRLLKILVRVGINRIMKNITIYTDGALRRYSDFKLGAWCYYMYDENGIDVKARIEDGDEVTNNRMEVQAVIEAFKRVADNTNVHLYADSQYVLYGLARDCVSKSNPDLWRQLADLIKNKHLSVKTTHVYGHQGITGNEVADKTMRAMLDQVIKKRKHAMQMLIF